MYQNKQLDYNTVEIALAESHINLLKSANTGYLNKIVELHTREMKKCSDILLKCNDTIDNRVDLYKKCMTNVP